MPDANAIAPINAARLAEKWRWAMPLCIGGLAGLCIARISEHGVMPGSPGVYFGSTFFAALLAPSLAAAFAKPARRIGAVGGLGLAILAMWLGYKDGLGAGRCFQCWLVLLTFLFALTGIGAALTSRREKSTAGGIVTGVLQLAAMLYLTWPLWLGGALHSTSARWIAWITPTHPIFAIQGIGHFSDWSESPLFYRLSPLLEIPHGAPETMWPAVGFFGAIALLTYGVACLRAYAPWRR